jgi:predicted dehydrogenase
VLGSLHLDYYRRPPVHNLEIVCSQGLIQWDNADGAVRLYRADTEAWEHYSAPQGFDRNDLFLDELRNMIAVARGDAEPACSLSDGIRALELALLVHQSAREKRLISL